MKRISINADVGESLGPWLMGDDDALLQVVTDANVACGFHAGDPDVMRATCAKAIARGVRLGAHVGFYDLRGFGRRRIDVPKASLINDVLYQLGALQAIALAEGAPISFVKPHGALYHSAVDRTDHADAVVEAMRLFDPKLPLLCQPGTRLASRAKASGTAVVGEGFIDRRYRGDGLLVQRHEPGAVIGDHAEALRQSAQLATTATVTTIDGTNISMPVASLCVHSDSPDAGDFARATRAALDAAGVIVRSFCEQDSP